MIQPVQSFRDFDEFDNHEFIIALTDEKSGLKAYIAIHNTNLGPASGGTRIRKYDSDNSAIKDVLNLSKAMSYKCALAGLPFGGGKAVILESDSFDKRTLLTAYAKMVDRLGGLFKTGSDVGVTDDDVMHMSANSRHILGSLNQRMGNLSTSKVAALGVYHGMEAALEFLYNEANFVGKSVAIKGVGKLGGELAHLIAKSGGRVFISDIDIEVCKKIKNQIDDVIIVNNEDIHKQQVDIYAPCALGGEFSNKIIGQLNCRAIVGGANNQLCSSAVGDKIHKNGILYAPDYVVNAGGLIFVSDELEADGFNPDRVLRRASNIKETLRLIFNESKIQNIPTYKIADVLAFEKINKHET